MKENFNKEVVTTKILRILLNLRFMIMLMLRVMVNEEIVVISLENTDALSIETVMSRFI